MKRFHSMAVIAAVIVLAAVVLSAVAQQPTGTAARPAAPRPTVALLDVSRVFKENVRFKAMMEEMKASVQQAETQVRAEQEAIKKLAEQLKIYRKGTPEYNTREEELTKRVSDLKVRVELQRKRFLEQEAKIYHTVYQEIQQQVDYYCRHQGIAMVLRFNGTSVDDPAAVRPEDVLQNINKSVVWHNQNLDITNWMLNSLNQRAGGVTRSGPQGVPRATTPGVPRPGTSTVPHTGRPSAPYTPRPR